MSLVLQGGHVGLGPGLVNKDQALRTDLALILLPLRAPAGDVGTVTFAGDEAFLKLRFSVWTNSHTDK